MAHAALASVNSNTTVLAATLQHYLLVSDALFQSIGVLLDQNYHTLAPSLVAPLPNSASFYHPVLSFFGLIPKSATLRDAAYSS